MGTSSLEQSAVPKDNALRRQTLPPLNLGPDNIGLPKSLNSARRIVNYDKDTNNPSGSVNIEHAHMLEMARATRQLSKTRCVKVLRVVW
jgi:hypothetical protein